jgi:hypothetical protein
MFLSRIKAPFALLLVIIRWLFRAIAWIFRIVWPFVRLGFTVALPHVIFLFVLVAFTWWWWINTAPYHLHLEHQPKQWFRSVVVSFIDSIKYRLLHPSSIYSMYIFTYLTITYVACVAFFHISRIASHFSPIHLSSWVDWCFPPTTIRHTVNSKDGKVSKTAREMKEIFTLDSFKLNKAHLAEDNTHKYAARRRLAAVKMAQAISKRIGYTIFDEQMSHRSAKHNTNGTRTIMMAKDACSFTSENLKYEVPDSENDWLVTHIDTFTHKDETDANTTLSDGNIHYIYTWNPDTVAGTSDEFKFRYDENGDFITTVEGSSPYTDQLWDFENDCLTTYTYEWVFSYLSFSCLFLALLMFSYNVYVNFDCNSHLTSVPFFGWMKIYHLHIYLPSRTYTVFHMVDENIGVYQALEQFISGFGLQMSFVRFFEGWRYPSIYWNSFFIPYPWTAQPAAMQFEHHHTILSLLLMAFIYSYHTVVYCHKIIRLDVGEQRTIIVIIPNCKFKGFAASLRWGLLSETALKRRIPLVTETEGGHKFLAEKRKNPSGHSVAFLDSHESHFIEDTVIDMAKSLATGKSDPSLANVRVSSKSEGVEANRVAVALAIAITARPGYSSGYSSNYGYYPLPTIIRQTDDEKADGVPVKEVMANGAMPPVVKGGAFVHARSQGQMIDIVKRRLRDPQDKINPCITPEIAEYIAEFARHICHDVGGDECAHLEPISEEEYELSRSRNQLSKFKEVVNTYDINNLEDRTGFMKREVLAKPTKAGRGICTFPAESQALGGRISLAYAAALKSCKWVAAGLNPHEITDAVLEVCAGASDINETDMTAQDATIELYKRAIELMLLLRCFAPEWHEIIQDWHYTDYHGRVLYGEPGTKREPHDFNGSRGSGSPFTTYGNTPLTGCFAYIALRIQGLSCSEAYAKLGVYSGDDGITANLQPAASDEAARALGFILKSKVRETNISFLGRVFHDPIGGSRSSIQSPHRTLAKLHTTLVNTGQFTAHEAMIMKAICLQVTDRNSDFFGPWSKKIITDAGVKQTQNLKAKVLEFPGLHSYFAITALQTNTTYCNYPGDFLELFEEEMPGFSWSEFNDWLENGTGPCPCLWEGPEPTDEEMLAVGPVTLAMAGVHDEAQMVYYDADSDPSVSENSDTRPQKKKRHRKRTPDEQKELRRTIAAAGLLDKYRAAGHVPGDPADVNKERREIRAQIEQQARAQAASRSQ